MTPRARMGDGGSYESALDSTRPQMTSPSGRTPFTLGRVLSPLWTNPFLIRSSRRLVCECANVTAAAGYTYFGIQFFGECWTGENPDVAYDSGGKSNSCFGQNFLPCDASFSSCAGEENVNYVYRINLGQSSPGKLITIYKRKSKCSLIFVRSLFHLFVLMKWFLRTVVTT